MATEWVSQEDQLSFSCWAPGPVMQSGLLGWHRQSPVLVCGLGKWRKASADQEAGGRSPLTENTVNCSPRRCQSCLEARGEGSPGSHGLTHLRVQPSKLSEQYKEKEHDWARVQEAQPRLKAVGQCWASRAEVLTCRMHSARALRCGLRLLSAQLAHPYGSWLAGQLPQGG